MRTSAVERLFGEDDRRDPLVLRAMLRERIAELEEDISELREYSNSLSPAILLPPEILCKIFNMYRRRHKFETDERFLHRIGSVKWIRITHVCHRWREVAIACPSLWSDLSFLYPAFTEVMLQRSENAPLCIGHLDGLTWQQSPNEALLKMLHNALSLTERLETVSVYTLDEGPGGYLSLLAHFTSRVPNLKKLSLTASGEGGGPPFTGDLFGGDAPALQTLELRRAPVTLWNALPFGSTSLTFLRLFALDKNLRPVANIFFGALSRMSNLETLDLG